MRLTLHLCVSRAIPDLTLYVRLFKCFIAMVGPYLTLHLCVSRAIPDLALYVRLFKCCVAMVGPCA